MSARAETPFVPGGTWHEANQKHLAAALQELRGRLESWASANGVEIPGNASAGCRGDATEWRFPQMPALEQLCRIFGLSDFERNLLLLCAGAEMDSRIAQFCVSVDRRSRPMPSFGAAMAVLPEAHWTSLSPERSLRSWQLIEIEPGETLLSSGLRINERILHFLAGVAALDARLLHMARPVAAPDALVDSHAALARTMAATWAEALRPSASHGGAEPRLPMIELCGDSAETKGSIAAYAAALLGLRLYALDARALPQNDMEEARLLVRLWEREAILSDAALFLELPHPSDSAETAWIVRLLQPIERPLALDVVQPLGGVERTRVILTVQKPTRNEQEGLWRAALRDTHLDPLQPSEARGGVLDAVLAQFNLAPASIWSAAQQASGASPDRIDTGGVATMLWDACRLHARPWLEGLATRVEAMAEWEDLILPAREKEMLRRMCLSVRNRARVYDDWGFARKNQRGLGMNALFAGPSGTGKTMAAEVLARELRLDLFRIDLSQTVSKYIGETEKNLRQIFDAAEEGAALLLFDEADALFGKRSEVKDSHDRYANIEVSYLLQRMEAYRGLAILTTNRRNAIDPAFLRRIRFVVDFPFPEAAQRQEIWRRAFPEATPTENLRIDRLAALRVSGGNIHNIALGAAFLAADAQQPVRMDHVITAARTEFAKLDMPFAEAEVAGWA